MGSASTRPDRDIAATITCIISDVDGVLSDGRIVYDTAGVETKSFHVRDGLGIKMWLRAGFHFGIITARQSETVTRRASELGVASVMQNVADKWAAANAMMTAWNISPDQVAYIGDDLPDLVVMRQVGLSVAPADAATDVLTHAHWSMRLRGGDGVIRELIERLMRAGDRWPTPEAGTDGRSC